MVRTRDLILLATLNVALGCTGGGLPIAEQAPVVDAGTRPGAIAIEQTADRFGVTTFFGEQWPPHLMCKRSQIGGCELFVCPQFGSGSSDLASAGIVTIAGLTTVSISPSAFGSYRQTLDTGHLFTPGQRLKISATGDEVPEFSTDLLTPETVVLTEPMWIGDEEPAFDRTQPLLLSWYAVPDTTVAVELSSRAMPTSLHCQLPAADGKGEIPVEALAKLDAGEYFLAVAGRSARDFTVGDFTVVLSAVAKALKEDGTRSGGTVTLK